MIKVEQGKNEQFPIEVSFNISRPQKFTIKAAIELSEKLNILITELAPSSVPFNGVLGRLVRLKPQVSELKHGAEPSIRELIFNYYADHDMENPEQLTSYYLSELEKIAV